MADTPYSVLDPINSIMATDGMVIVRGGVPYRFSGVLPVINASGDLALPSGRSLFSGDALLAGGDGGANSYYYGGTNGTLWRNAANNATLMSLSDAGGLGVAGNIGVGTAIGSNIGAKVQAPNSSNLAAMFLESGGNHAISVQLNTGGRNYIMADYFVAGPRLPLALSGSGGADVVIATDGSVSLTTATTASAANLYQASSGSTVLRSTSSIRYKKDVEDLDPEFADRVLRARPVWYRSKAEADNSSWGYYGLIAEELAEIDPRLVQWGYQEDQYEQVEIMPARSATPAVRVKGKVVEPAQPARPAMLELRLKPGEQLRPDGVQYERLSVLLLDVVRRQRDQLNSLAERVTALEAAGVAE